MLAKPEVIQILSHATVFACPSLYEPLGIVNLEAMACGTAVVASAVGGIPEVVQDGQTGLLVPAGDDAALAAAINLLLADPARAAEFGARGRAARSREFSWDYRRADGGPVRELAGTARRLTAHPGCAGKQPARTTPSRHRPHWLFRGSR